MLFTINIKNKGVVDGYINGSITYTENNASILTFTILQNNKFINKLEKFIDKAYVLNNLGEKIFAGRVLEVKKSMNSQGEFINEVTCESPLNYLVDVTVPKWNLYANNIPDNAPKGSIGNVSVKMLLEKILEIYNSVSLVKINLGNITVNDYVTIKTNRQTCLEVISQALIKNFGGFIQIREVNGEYYLDYLKEYPTVSGNNLFNIGININSLQINGSLASICTRLIGIGSNNKLEAIAENDVLIKEYGVMDKVVQYKDVTTQEELQYKVNRDIKTINANILNANISALDLSYINNDFSALTLYQNVTIICKELDYNQNHYIASITLDLLKPYSSTFSLNTNKVNQINQITQIIQENNQTNLEILDINGQLIEKVSNGEFESYKEQTATQIDQKVSNGEFESYKEQTATEIDQKVSNGEFESYKEQTSTEINQKVSNGELTSSMTEYMNEFDFQIGNGTALTLTQNELEMKFNNGTTLNITKNGFVWNQSGKPFNYKSVVKSGTISNVQSNETRCVNLPEEFKYMNGDYQFIYWAGNVELPNSNCVLYAADVIQTNANIDNGQFWIKADVMVTNPEIGSTPYWAGKLNIMWLAIG